MATAEKYESTGKARKGGKGKSAGKVEKGEQYEEVT